MISNLFEPDEYNSCLYTMKKIAQIAIISSVLSTAGYAQSAESDSHLILSIVSLPASQITFKFEEGKIFYVKIPSEKLRLKVKVPDEPTFKMLTQEQQRKQLLTHEQQRKQQEEEDKKFQARQDAVVQNTQAIAGNYNLTDITLEQLQAQEKEVVVANDDLTVKVVPLVGLPTDTILQQQQIEETVKENKTVQQELVGTSVITSQKTIQKPAAALINISYAETSDQATAKVLDTGNGSKIDNLNLKSESIPLSIRRQHNSVIGRYIPTA